MRTSAQYLDATLRLMPPGSLVPTTNNESNLKTLLEWIGDSLLTVDNAANSILADVYPDQIGAFLEDWERVAGLPPEGITGQSFQDRRAAVLTWLNMSALSTKQFFVDIAALMGFSITVEDKSDDGALGAYQWRVTAAATAPTTLFRTGNSRAGEGLVEVGSNDPLEALINFFAPAHTTVIYNYI